MPFLMIMITFYWQKKKEIKKCDALIRVYKSHISVIYKCMKSVKTFYGTEENMVSF